MFCLSHCTYTLCFVLWRHTNSSHLWVGCKLSFLGKFWTLQDRYSLDNITANLSSLITVCLFASPFPLAEPELSPHCVGKCLTVTGHQLPTPVSAHLSPLSSPLITSHGSGSGRASAGVNGGPGRRMLRSHTTQLISISLHTPHNGNVTNRDEENLKSKSKGCGETQKACNSNTILSERAGSLESQISSLKLIAPTILLI